jgi:hypothetical protein
VAHHIYGASAFIRVHPQPPPVSVDDRPANRQAHSYAAMFRGGETPEKLAMPRINARPGIAHWYKHALRLSLVSAGKCRSIGRVTPPELL